MLKVAQYPIKKRIKLHGFDISVENPKGSARHWKDPHSGESGTTTMKHDYGYFRRTEGTDGDHVDVYVGPDTDSGAVFIIDQLKKPDFKQFDEQKVMLGFKDAKAAKAAYLAHYNDPRFFGSMKEMAVKDFKDKVLSKENHGKKIAKETGMPFQSKRQMRAAFGGHIPGISKEKAKEWAKETPDLKDLPDRAPAEKGKPTLLSKESQLAHAADSGKGISPAALRRGQKVEMEHTKSPSTARQIATDHLRERPDYYARLAEAEKSAALSSTAIRALQHGGIGAGAGALLGAGIGAYRADPEDRRRGALKGALTGAGIGFAGGAGGSLLHSRIKAPQAGTMAPAPVSSPVPATQAVTQNTGRPAIPPPQSLNFPKRTSAFQVTSPSEFRHLEGQGWKLGPKDMLYPPHQFDQFAKAMDARAETIIALQEKAVANKAASDVSSLEAQLRQMQAEKAHEDRLNSIANHFDHLGLAVLASPYVADAAEKATKALMLRGGRVGNIGAHLHTAAEGAQHFLHSHPLLVEGGGLALVAPGITHRLAKAVNHFRPGSHQPLAPSVPEQPMAASDMRAMSAAAEKVGRLLAHPAPQEKVAINVSGAIQSVGNFAVKNRKTLAGIGAVGAVGAGLYGAKKGIDAVSHMATAPREPASYVGVPPGMRAPTPAYMPVGS